MVVGNAGGGALDVELWSALQANQSLLGVFMGTQLEKPQVHAAVSRILEQAARAEIDVPIAQTFSLDEIAKAHRYAEEAAILGRVVIRPQARANGSRAGPMASVTRVWATAASP